MKKTPLLLTAILTSLTFNASAQKEVVPLVDRVERLERMADNPVLLQLSRRLGDLNREIQNLQDENDRLRNEVVQLKKKQAEQYKETDDRLSELQQSINTGRASSDESQTVSSLTPAPVVPPKVIVAMPVEEPATKQVQSTPTSKQPASPETPVAAKPDLALEEPAAVAPAVADQTAVPTATADTAEVTPETTVEDEGEIKTRPATAEEKALYKMAFNEMKAGNYEKAVTDFQSFRQAHKDSQLASNVSYWSGEAYLILDKPEDALLAFKDVVTHYPISSKAPASMLRAADTMKQLKQIDEARVMYKKLLDQFPDDRVAAKAKKRLAEIQ